MTTPQGMLHSVYYKVCDMHREFLEYQEKIDEIHTQIAEIKQNQQAIFDFIKSMADKINISIYKELESDKKIE